MPIEIYNKNKEKLNQLLHLACTPDLVTDLVHEAVRRQGL